MNLFILTFVVFILSARALNGTCPAIRTNEPCIPIDSWSDFETVVSASNPGDVVVFCPFQIVKSSLSHLILSKQITLVCQKQEACIILSMTKPENRLFKIRGNEAQVIISGFTFQQRGVSKGASIRIMSDSNVTEHAFCFCRFESSNIGGVAIKSEAGTTLKIVSCIFEWNSRTVLLNKGVMDIEASSFQKDSGIVVRSSPGAKTTLKGNLFITTSPDNSLELFRNKGTFDDLGGNKAYGLFNCIGIYLATEDRCVEFQEDAKTAENNVIQESKESSPSNSVTVSTKSSSACKTLAKDGNNCITISEFSDLRHAILKANPGSTLLFCSFTVSKPRDEILYIEKELSIGCIGGNCTIRGPGYHMKVRNQNRQVIVQGITFEGSTNTALHILSSTELAVCDCVFLNNNGSSTRGVALLAERGTNVHIETSHFENNFSSDMGGSIFSRGTVMILTSTFRNNKGVGSAIAVAPRSSLSLFHCEFKGNDGGPPIFFHERTVLDLGQNKAIENSVCNGILIQRENNVCVPFQSASKQTMVPSVSQRTTVPSLIPSNSPTVSRNIIAIRGEIGYFNYDPNDEVFGPYHWGSVENNSEYFRYQELSETLQRSLVNKCEREDVLQSPIDICEDKINAECFEHHQTRTHEGSMKFGDVIEAQILSSKLRLKYYADRTPEGGPYPPEGDFAHNWNGYAEVNHIDVKIPSEHTLCGKRFSAEYQIFMLHPKRRQTIVMAILLDIDPSGKDNNHFQLLIDEWQKIYDINAEKCDPTYRSAFHQNDYNITQRVLVEDNTPFGTGGWDPFHPSLERTIYHWGYWGSLTEAPCSNFVAWRILTEPAYISQKQLDQLKNILFTNVDDKCKLTTVNFMGSVARPTQNFKGRPLYKCSSSDYVSDVEKARIRKETGNPNWCC